MTFLPYQKTLIEMINIREDSMLDSKGLLEQLYLSDFAFMETGNDGTVHGINCNKLLSDILASLNCRMYQSNNQWMIERIYERINNTITYFTYTMTGGILTSNAITNSGTGTQSKMIAINNSSFPKIVNGSELAITKKQPVLAYKMNSNSLSNVQLINNPYFENTPTSVTGSPPLPLRWDRGAGMITTGGDQIETINPYESDPKYVFGYSFGAAAIEAQRNYLNALSGWNINTLHPFASTYYIHSVLRTGDTWSQPALYLDQANGLLAVDIKTFIKITFTVSTGITASQIYKYAQAIQNNILIFAPFQISLQNPAGGNNYGYGAIGGLSFQSTWSTSTFKLTTPLVTSMLINCWYPNAGATAVYLGGTGLGFVQLEALIASASAGKGTGSNGVHSFDLVFRTDDSITVNLNTLTGANGWWKFDFKAYAPWYDKSGPSSINAICSTNIGMTLTDYALNAIDIQYKDQNNSASAFVGFYSTPDENNRWNELDVTPMFGDSTTAGYPGAFRVASGSVTGTWHEVQKAYTDHGTVVPPGINNYSLNNTTPSLATILYIDDTDGNGNNATAWLSSIKIGQYVLITGGGTYKVQVTGAPSAIGSYYSIPITYISGTCSFDDNYISYEGGIILADILFQKYIQICGNYRHNLKAKMLGHIDYWQTVQDEDGKNYILLGHSLDIKNGQITSDMEEMSDTILAIAAYKGAGSVPFGTYGITTYTGPSASPMGVKTVSAVTKSSTITTPPSYPL